MRDGSQSGTTTREGANTGLHVYYHFLFPHAKHSPFNQEQLVNNWGSIHLFRVMGVFDIILALEISTATPDQSGSTIQLAIHRC